MIRFTCECGRQLQAREENAGKLVRCPACQSHLTVPNPPSASIQPEEPMEPATPKQRVQRERPTLGDESEAEWMPSQSEGSSGKAVISLVLGILSVFCNVLTGLPALVVGVLALRDIGRRRERLAGRGLAMAGIITACVGTLLSCGILIPIMLLVPAVQRVREAAARAQQTGMNKAADGGFEQRVREAADHTKSQNNLKEMALAMLNYQEMQGRLPAAAICDKRGRPLLSWRVAILPYLLEKQQALHAQFKLDEPWDSPNNIRLLGQMPKVYKLLADDKSPLDHTHYQVFVGNGAAFEITKPMIFPKDFPDGTSNTIFIVEAENAVPWTKPEDVPFDPSKPIVPLMSRYFRGGFNVALVDCSVRKLAPQISEKTLKAAITRRGGEPLGPDW